MSNIEVKIITKEKAQELGLTGGGSVRDDFIHGKVVHVATGKIVEEFKINKKTKKQEIIFQDKNYKKLRNKK